MLRNNLKYLIIQIKLASKVIYHCEKLKRNVKVKQRDILKIIKAELRLS